MGTTLAVKHRRLAILAADAVGYSRLMALDDVQTLASLERARAVFRSRIEAERGRVVDMAGDSVLAVFESAVAAVHTALGAQWELSAGIEIAEDRKLRYRIGVHIGEVIEKDDGTVYGDDVNIAARLQALAEPDTIVVSGTVRDAVAAHLRARFEDLGERSVKNIPGLIHAFALRRPSSDATEVEPKATASSTSAQPGDVAANVPPLLERESATRAFDAALFSARKGEGRTCLVFGEAGIGKTSICEAFLAAAPDLRLLRGGCEALLSPRPLGPLHDFIGQLTQHDRLSIGDLDSGAALFPRVLDCLRAEPTALFLEDLHWADEGTLDFVRYVARRVPETPILLILTYRDDELPAAHPLRRVIGDLQRGVVRIPLKPLTAAGVAELARRAQRSAAGVLAITGGNPFFVTELLESGGLPGTIVDAVRARVARQSEAVRDVLESASIVPRRIEHWIVDALIDAEGSAVHAALASGLLVADEDGLRFRHELARRAVEQSVAAPKLRRMHGQLLDFLEAQAERAISTARLVHHAKAAGRASDVLRHAPVAAREASRRGAHREAAKLYESALEAAGSAPHAERARLLEACAWESLVSDAATISVQRYEEALAIWRSEGSHVDQGRVMTRLARSYWLRCRGADCLRINREAVAILQANAGSTEYLEALVEVTRAEMLAGRNAIVFEVGAQALELARSRGNERLVGHLLNNIGTAHCQSGDLGTGIELLERSLSIGRTAGEEDLVGRYYINMAYQAVEHLRYDEAERLFAVCEKEFPPGDESDLYYWQGTGWQAHASLARGHWERAEAQARRALMRYRASSELPFRIHALLPLARLRMLRGAPGVEDLLDEAVQLASSMHEPQRIGPAAAIRCERKWLQEGTLGAMADEMATLLRWFVALGRQAYIDEIAFWLWRCGHGGALDGVQVTGPRSLQIGGRWREAAAAWQDLGCPLEAAQSLLDGDAAAHERATDAFARLGATAYLAKAAALSARRSISGA